MSSLASRLPPNQQWAAPHKWPLVGERAAQLPAGPYTVRVCGAVDHAQTFSLESLASWPQAERTLDIHCVTRWSKPDQRFGGVLLATLLAAAAPAPGARFVSYRAYSARDHSTSMPLSEALSLETLIATTHDGAPLSPEHGGPVRVITPGRYFYKSLKWLAAIELTTDDVLGYWERIAGYHNRGEPWREERYVEARADARRRAALAAERNLAGQDVLGLDANGLTLAGLQAQGAVLRNADFRGSELALADFSGANLSNARFAGANLRGASFVAADLEGADFTSADLRGADLSQASLVGASFCSTAATATIDGAKIDPSTRLDAAALEQLSPEQERFVRSAC